MKKIIIGIVALFLILPISVEALEKSDIHSNEALLVNMNTDEILFSKNTNSSSVPIASLTKLMTYAVVIDEINDLEGTKMVVPDGLVQDMINMGASRAGLLEGYEYTVLDLLYGLMIPSGCDAAEVLAINIGNGDSSIFVEKMNEKARSLGMNNTYFVDSYGIGTENEDNVSTEEDLYLLIKHVYRLPYFKKIISTEYHAIYGEKEGDIKYSSLRNTNYLMGEYNGGKYYIPYSIGGKTGNLNVAGRCLITVAAKGDLEVVAITLGVPGEYGSAYDYHFNDNINLLNYAFENYTNNITIEVGTEFRSLEIGKQHKIEAITSSETEITWTSNNPDVATVDENGIVTGISQGQAKITAITSTGNIDYTYVSVNCYNGVHVKYSTGTVNPSGGWNPIDFKVLKDKGFDYVIIRAGYGSQTTDNTFYENFESAIENNMNIGIWFEGYAENIEEAEAEAKNLLSILEIVAKEKINLPIFYNLFYSNASNPDDILGITNAFKTLVEAEEFEVVLELGKTKLSTIETEKMNESDLDLSIIYRTLPPNYENTMTANEKEASFWNYKQNAYLGENLGTNAQLSIMYMNYKKINTNHAIYIPPIIEEEKEQVSDLDQPMIVKPIISNLTYTYNNLYSEELKNNEEKNTNSNDEEQMQNEINNKVENLEPEKVLTKDTKDFNMIMYFGITLIVLIVLGIFFYVKKNNINK